MMMAFRSRSINNIADSLRKMSSASATVAPHTLLLENMNPCIKKMEYAVRGPLVIRATEIEKELAAGVKKPFANVIKANIGDAHAMGNKPITFIRQVLALITHPPLLDSPDFPEDAKDRARTILAGCKGSSVGSYSDSPGLEVIRRHVADYIAHRDGFPCDWQNVMLCAGASEGIRACLKLMTSPGGGQSRPAVMIPTPQYPLYSASLAEYNMEQVGYYLDEERNWAMDVAELERSINVARREQNLDVKAIVIINPGNPTGQVLSRDNVESVIRFAAKEKLFIFADEVYQHNVYAEGSGFHSFKKVANEMGAPFNQLEMASFMTCSKGYMGECGIRGGYSEVVNMDPSVMAMLQKSISAKLCPTVIGQACMDTVVNPPRPGEPSYHSWKAEVEGTIASLKKRAKLVENTLNSIEGIHCNEVQGAMYAFPQVTLPPKAVEAAQEAGQAPDVFYAFHLLEATGICVVPGSGFGQRPGTFHFRTTILPPEEMILEMLGRLREFHLKFLKEYA